jgi:alpha-mannosidase
VKNLAQQFVVVGMCAAWFFSPLQTRAANPRVKEIVVVFKTHFDIGYTDLATNVLTRYRTSFVDGAMKLIDQSQSLPPDEQFVWTIPGWPLKEMLWPGQTPERREKILRAFKAGRLVVHALPFNTETETLGLEDLVRGMTFSANLCRENGLPLPRAAKMTDVPEHTWILPTLLRHAGVDFLQIGCNGGSAKMRVPPLFWWVGPDGSRLLTSYSPQYGTQLMPPDDWPYHTWLALIVAGDNHGPPTAGEVDNLLKQAARDLPEVKIKFGKLEDFYDAVIGEADKFPVVRGDMPDTWIHGFEALPIETSTAWHVHPQEAAVGVLDTELRAAGVKTPPLASLLAEAYENSLLYSEHTFGFDSAKAGGWRYGDDWKHARAGGKYALFERSFDDKRNYIRTAANLTTNALGARMQLLAENVKINGPRVVVFNPLPWRRSGEVTVNAPGGAVQFLAGDVPASGYKTFKLPAKPKIAEEFPGHTAVIENKFFRLQVDPARGCVTSLIDLRSGRELAGTATHGRDAGANTEDDGFGEYLHQRFSASNVDAFVKSYSPNWKEKQWVFKDFGKPNMPDDDQSPSARITLTHWTISIQQDGSAKTVTLRCTNAAPLANAVTIRYTLYHAKPYLDIEWAIDGKTPNPIPEGGWICLPFAIEHPEFRLARLGSIIDPATDIIEGGNRHLLCLNSGMTVTGPDGFGVGICPLDSPLVSLDEPGLWLFSLHFIPKRARIYVNLYNNQWDTNFPLWQDGSWRSRIRLWVVGGKRDEEKGLITPSWEARSPLVAAFADGAGGKLPAESKGLELSRRGVLVTTFGADPYSDKTLLRLWEVAGGGGKLTVKLPPGMDATRARPVNLRGEPAGIPIEIKNGSFATALPAFAPASFVFDNRQPTNAINN